MGSALAQAALLMGAEVTVVSGPSEVPLPLRARAVRVKTAVQMSEAVVQEAADADLVVGAAAVSDYRPSEPTPGKRRRSGDPWVITLVPNPDVLAEAAKGSKKGAMVIGFAAEPSADLEAARAKIAQKGLFAIAVNDVSRPDIGFESDQNELTLVFGDGRNVPSGRRSKLACALWLFEQILDPSA
jgi:phosphopantothenoylcysteine decarboxylase/phosphopantothenate--cysteine ligase